MCTKKVLDIHRHMLFDGHQSVRLPSHFRNHLMNHSLKALESYKSVKQNRILKKKKKTNTLKKRGSNWVTAITETGRPHLYTHLHTYIHTYIHMHTHTYTHTPKRATDCSNSNNKRVHLGSSLTTYNIRSSNAMQWLFNLPVAGHTWMKSSPPFSHTVLSI